MFIEKPICNFRAISHHHNISSLINGAINQELMIPPFMGGRFQGFSKLRRKPYRNFTPHEGLSKTAKHTGFQV